VKGAVVERGDVLLEHAHCQLLVIKLLGLAKCVLCFLGLDISREGFLLPVDSHLIDWSDQHVRLDAD